MAIVEDPEGNEIAALIRMAPFLDGARVLEVGSGYGRLTARYAEKAKSIIAIDPDVDAIDELAHDLPDVAAHAVGFEAFDLQDASVDVVLFAWSL